MMMIDLECKSGRIARLVDELYQSRYIKQLEITQEQYPNAYAYFECLRVKYPVALGNVCIMMVNNEKFGPCCKGSTILFPKSWIEELEKGNSEKLLQTEWVILHEAGHVHYGHSLTCGLLQSIPLGLLGKFMILYSRLKAEPQADTFACEHCDNPEAMQAVIDWFNKEGRNDWAHPSIKSRIAKIKQAMQQE